MTTMVKNVALFLTKLIENDPISHSNSMHKSQLPWVKQVCQTENINLERKLKEMEYKDQ